MKKFFSVFLCFILMFAVLACTKQNADIEPHDTEVTAEQTEEPTPESAEATPEAAKEPEHAEPIVLPEGIVEAVDGLNPLEPAKFGEWVKAFALNPATENPEPIYWRVTEVTDDCEEAIKEYNEKNSFWAIDPLEDEALKYYIVSYEVYFPVEFTERDFGISAFTLDINIRNIDGGAGFEHNGAHVYGLNSGLQFDIGRYEKTVHPGDIYQGKILYRMYEDIDDYLFSVFYQTFDSEEYVTCFCSNKAAAAEDGPVELNEENWQPIEVPVDLIGEAQDSIAAD